MDVELHGTLSGQVALVTGANRGLGAVTAAALADHGATVYAGTRDRTAIDATGPLRAVELDVADDAQIDAAIERITDETDRLDVLSTTPASPPEPAKPASRSRSNNSTTSSRSTSGARSC